MKEICEVIARKLDSELLIVCDHASKHIPAQYQKLGLSDDVLDSHIGWDKGSEPLAVELASQLKANLVCCRFSRLLIDCNRFPHDLDSIPKTVAGINIPGNLNITKQEREHRIEKYFYGYHNTVSRLLEEIESEKGKVFLLSIHSFNETIEDFTRPWHIGVLANNDYKFGSRFYFRLKKYLHGKNVAFNLPYSGEFKNYSLDTHGTDKNRKNFAIELRRDQTDRKNTVLYAENIKRALIELFNLNGDNDEEQIK